MRTCINDDFPVDSLECQYFDICKYFNSDQCNYGAPCSVTYVMNNKPTISLRALYRRGLENYVSSGNLEMQIKMRLEDEKK